MSTFIHWLNTYWSYILAPFGLAGMYVSGKKKAWGWLLSLFTQTLWLAYAFTTKQYGFMPGTLAYAFIYVKNWRAWRVKPKKVKKGPLEVADSHIQIKPGISRYEIKNSE